jgi:MFS family permease
LASLLPSILMFSAFLSQPLFGILSDRTGGKPHVLRIHHGSHRDELHRSSP